MSLGSSSQPQAVVLLSGGLDSATTLAVARRDGFACRTLAIDYGQRHRHELTAAEHVSRALGALHHTTLTLDLRVFGGSALTDNIAVPKGRSAAQMSADIPITYVPARNLVFLSLATAMAEVHHCSRVYIGVNAVDYSGYPDCRPEFINSFAHTAGLATRIGVQGEPVQIITPLLHLSKAQIITLGTHLGVDFSQTHSCYDPITRDTRTLACGMCDSCILRRDGFAAANLPDPTPYAISH
jgi:7-cyano-7-deazaguanine synthase